MSLCVEALYDKSPPYQICCHRHCGSGDTKFLVVEEKDSKCSYLNPPLLFTLEHMARHGC